MKLVFLRHGEAEHSLPGWRGDTAPANLTPAGRQAAAEAAQQLARFRFSAIYASPFIRTRQTAAIAAKAQESNPKVRIDARLADVDVKHHPGSHFRRWQLGWRLRLKLMARRQQFARQRLPGGQRLDETAQPAAEFIGMLKKQHPKGSVLVVGHLHTFWMLSHHLRDEPFVADLQSDHFVAPASWREMTT